MADTVPVDETNPAPLEITITPKPSYAPDIPSEGPPAAPPREFGQDAGVSDEGSFGDTYTKLAQLQQGRAARQALDALSAGETARPRPEGTPALPETAPAATARSLGARALSGAGDVAKDIARGVMQAPRAVVQGAGEAVKEVAATGASLGEWLSKKTDGWLGPVSIDDYRKILKADPKTAADAELPDAELWKRIETAGKKLLTDLPLGGEHPDTVTGGLIQDTAQFLTGMAIGGKLLKGANVTIGGVGKTLATSTFSDFAARDPDAKRLADLIQKYPALQNPVTEFLQAGPDDSEVVKRLKSAVEGVGMGTLGEGFVRAVGALRARVHAGAAVTNHGSLIKQMEEDAAAKYGRMSEEAMALIGDPKAPLVKKLTAGQKASVAAKKIETGGRDMSTRADLTTIIDGKAYPVRGESLPTSGLAPANLTDKGVVYVGRPNGLHFQIAEKFPAEKHGAHINPGFITPDGKFLNREQALKWVNENEKTVKPSENMGTGLDAMDYREQVPANRRLSVEAPPPIEQSAQEMAAGLVKTTDAGGNEVYVNFARIDGTEAVKKTIGLMADAGKARIDLKRGGEKQTFARMEELAADVNMSVTDLLARRSGSPMSAAEALAARSLLTASAERLTELAGNIAGGTARPAEEFAFRRQMAIHAAIQAEVIAARTETARALASWNIPRGGGIEASKAIHETLEAAGGSASTQELARRLVILQAARPGNLGAMSDFVRKGVTARTIDAAMEAWKSAMLSGPTTHLSNIFSNTLTMAISIPERRLGALISETRGTVDGVAAGEANALAHGMVEASKESFRMAWMALKTGDSQFGRSSGKADLTPQRAISKEALGLPDNVWGNSVDYIGKGFNVPFRLLTAEDEFFKTMTYRMELHAQAQRVAQSEGLVGDAAAARMKQVIDNPPEAVRLAAQDFALASTFNRELTGAMAQVARARSDDGTVGRLIQFVFPFFRTPVNVFSAAVERSPLAFLTQQFRADVAAGGARQDLALARMATGTTIMLVAADLADQGLVTGMISSDEATKEASTRQGRPPYSVKIGGKWVSYNRLDPVAMPIAVAANMAELARRFEVEPDKLDSFREILAAGIGGTAKAALDRSFMQGTAGLIQAIADPTAHADQYVKQTLTGFFTPAISKTVSDLVDPTQRETFDVIDAIEARIVGLSQTLIPRMDIWGRDVRLAESGAGRGFDVISPLKVETARPNPIDGELIRLDYFPKRIDKRGQWDGAPVEFANFPQVYAEYARLAGNTLKLPQYDDKGAMDFLNGLVEGKSGYDAYWKILTDGKEGGKARFIQKVIDDYRKEARRSIEMDPRFGEFRQYLSAQGIDAAVKKAPTEPEREAAPMIPRGALMAP